MVSTMRRKTIQNYKNRIKPTNIHISIFHLQVCCPIESFVGKNYAQYDVIETINDGLLHRPSDVRKHRNLRYLPTNCGNFPPIDHEKLKNNDFPWTVQLIYSSGTLKRVLI